MGKCARSHQLRPLLPLQLKFSATIPMKIAADARAHFIATVITLMTSQFIRTMPSLHFPCFCVFSSFLRIALLNATSSSHGPLSHCPVCLSLIVLFKGRRNVLFALPYGASRMARRFKRLSLLCQISSKNAFLSRHRHQGMSLPHAPLERLCQRPQDWPRWEWTSTCVCPYHVATHACC